MTGKLRLEWVDPQSLTEHPRNWRRHTRRQTEALSAVLDRVGWAGALLYNERTGRLIDGHLRLDIARKRKEPVPVLVGSWDEDEEKVILASLDPITGMADADTDRLEALLAEIAQQDAIGALLAEMVANQTNIISDLAPGVGDGGSDESNVDRPHVAAASAQTDSAGSASDSPGGRERFREDMRYTLHIDVSYEQKLLVEMAMKSTGRTGGELLELGARVALGEQ